MTEEPAYKNVMSETVSHHDIDLQEGSTLDSRHVGLDVNNSEGESMGLLNNMETTRGSVCNSDEDGNYQGPNVTETDDLRDEKRDNFDVHDVPLTMTTSPRGRVSIGSNGSGSFGGSSVGAVDSPLTSLSNSKSPRSMVSSVQYSSGGSGSFTSLDTFSVSKKNNQPPESPQSTVNGIKNQITTRKLLTF